MKKLLALLFITLLCSNAFCGPHRVQIDTTLSTRLFFLSEYMLRKLNLADSTPKDILKNNEVKKSTVSHKEIDGRNGVTYQKGDVILVPAFVNYTDLPNNLRDQIMYRNAGNVAYTKTAVDRVLACNRHGCALCDVSKDVAINTINKKGLFDGKINCDYTSPVPEKITYTATAL